jgi:hypothetical protein
MPLWQFLEERLPPAADGFPAPASVNVAGENHEGGQGANSVPNLPVLKNFCSFFGGVLFGNHHGAPYGRTVCRVGITTGQQDLKLMSLQATGGPVAGRPV